MRYCHLITSWQFVKPNHGVNAQALLLSPLGLVECLITFLELFQIQFLWRHPAWRHEFLIFQVSDGLQRRNACFDLMPNDNNCCDHKTEIAVKNCGTYFVYYLLPTAGCSMAYCIGKLWNSCLLVNVIENCSVKNVIFIWNSIYFKLVLFTCI